MRLLFLLSALLVSCTTTKPIAIKDGKTMFQTHCKKDIGRCYSAASEKCQGEFDIVNSNSANSGYVPVGGMLAATHQHDLFYTCKN